MLNGSGGWNRLRMGIIVSLKKHWKTAAALFVVGVALAFVLKNNSGSTGLVFVSDAFFSIAMVFLIWGLIHMVGNMNVFASMIYGTKCLVKLIRGKQDSSQTVKEGYLEYLKTRRRHTDIVMVMLFAGGFFVLSVLFAFFA